MTDATLFVVSDLHAIDSRFTHGLSATAPTSSSPGLASWLDYADRAELHRDPMHSLLALVGERHVRADYLVVGGDICDRANGAALEFAWAELEQLRMALGA